MQLGKLLCPTCDKLKFRCVCPKPTSPSTTPIKPPPPTMPQSATSSTHSLQKHFVRSSYKSTDSLDAPDYGQNNHSIDNDSNPRSASRLFQSFQWSNVFNGRNSKSTSHLNLVNCDKMHTVSVPNQAMSDAPTPHDQLLKGLNFAIQPLRLFFLKINFHSFI